MTPALPDGVWLDPSLAAQRFDVDTVVLDVDGVLIDVHGSFREAVRETVVQVQREMGVAEPWRPTHADINTFKRAGGFNDDIEISIALSAIGAAGRQGDAEHIAMHAEASGGGLSALRGVAPDLPRVEGRRVLQIFDDLYWGVPATDGLINGERTLVGAHYPRLLREAGARHLACISGRTPKELTAALRKLGWDRAELAAVVTGDMARKPDPACFTPVIDACAPQAMVYVGDVRDDWELVRRHNERRDDLPPARCILVGADDDMTAYRRLGVHATACSALDVPAILHAWRTAVAPQSPTAR